MATVLIERATVVTMNDNRDVLAGASIFIRDGKIERVIPIGETLPVADLVLDGKSRVAMPGFVNTHTHAPMVLLRGYADDMELRPWLEEKIWPIEGNLVEDDIRWGTLLAIVEMIRSGVTCFNDMYFYFDSAAQVCEESGIRACISGVLLGFLPNAEENLARAVEFAQGLKSRGSGRVVPMLGPHAPYTCPEPLLRKTIEAAKTADVGIHIHLSETKSEVDDSLAQHGKTPIAYMDSLRMFDVSPVLAAHCVWATDADIALLAEKRVGVAHNPGSNMKLASGAAPVMKMLAAGVHVGLGTDGAASNNNLDILEEARLAALLAKLTNADPTAVNAYEALSMACRGGAEALGLGDTIGQIKPGMQADIILIDTHQSHLWPPHDIVSNLVYAARASDVRTVLVDGVPLMIDGVLQTLDEERIMAEAAICAARLVQ